MIHVSVISVEQDPAWSFIASPDVTLQSSVIKRPSPKDATGPVYIDGSAITYALYCKTRLPLSSLPSEGRADLPYIPDPDDALPRNTHSLLPIATTVLIRAPANLCYNAVSMLQIHLLHTTKSPASSITISDEETHQEITHNYYELAMLAAYRWRASRSAILPLHLRALEVMHMTLGTNELQ